MKLKTQFVYTTLSPLFSKRNVTKTALKPKAPQDAWPFPYPGKKAEALEKALAIDGIHIIHCVGENNKGGVTIAWRKTTDYASSNFVEVAVAYCSKHDTFNKRIGRTNALFKFHNKNTVLVPAREHSDDYTVPENLRSMFWFSAPEYVLGQ